MQDKSEAAMEEGVKNSKVVIAVITGPCTNEDDPDGDPIANSYFKRAFCVKELEWAIKYNVPIQPVIRVEDKNRIGEFLSLAPEHLRFLGDTEWIDFNRSDLEYWEVGIKKLFRATGHSKPELSVANENSNSVALPPTCPCGRVHDPISPDSLHGGVLAIVAEAKGAQTHEENVPNITPGYGRTPSQTFTQQNGEMKTEENNNDDETKKTTVTPASSEVSNEGTVGKTITSTPIEDLCVVVPQDAVAGSVFDIYTPEGMF